MNEPTIEEQIAYQEQLLSNYQINPVVTLIGQSIRDSLKKLAALESQPVPVEPYGFSHIRQCYNDDRKIALSHFERDAIEYIDSLQSALQRAQEERDCALLVTGLAAKEQQGVLAVGQELIARKERAEKAEAINRRMVEQYRDLVEAAENHRCYKAQCGICEALAKLEES